MPTFSELLTDYMARTGIGEAELARRVQVSRLTVARWREGVTARPRYREDVLRCGEVLRLTAEETDAFLLAAGFAPESAPVPTETPPPDAAAPDDESLALAPPGLRPRRARRVRLLAALVLVAAAAAVGAFYVVGLQGRPPDHPVAGAGESLIVMAPFANYTGGQQGFNIQGRLKEEIDREISEAGLSRVRTVEWPRVIAAESDAVDAGVRSRAAMVIWGEYDSGRVLAVVTVPPSRQAQGSHGPQVVDIASSPSDLPAAVNFALADEVSSVALMTLGQLYLDQGDHDVAKTALIQALDRQSIDAATLAGLRFRLGRAYLGGAYADLDEAVWLFTQVLVVLPRSVDTLNNRALAYLGRGRSGDAALAIDDLSRAVSLDPGRAGSYLNRAVAYLDLDDGARLEPALDDLERAIDIDSDYASAYVNRASVYSVAKRRQRPRPRFRRYREGVVDRPRAGGGLRQPGQRLPAARRVRRPNAGRRRVLSSYRDRSRRRHRLLQPRPGLERATVDSRGVGAVDGRLQARPGVGFPGTSRSTTPSAGN